MWKVYVGATLLVFALASAACVAIMISPPQQHGRGMGAALLAGYVMLAWVAAAVNLAILGLVAWFRRRRLNRPAG